MARFTALLALLALLACTQAARMPDLQVIDADLPDGAVALSGPSSTSLSAAEDNGPIELEGGFTAGSGAYAADLEALASHPEAQASVQDASNKKGWPIRIATKFLVKPDQHGGFVRAFWRLQYKSKDAKGLRYLSLSKVAGDNIVWTSYAVYEDFGALIKHARSEGVRDFASYLTTANVPVSTKLLFRIAGGYHGSKNQLAASGSTSLDKKHHKKEWPVRLLTAYIVRPGEHCGFVKAWKKVEEKLGGRKGNIALSLSKPAGQNLVFVSYSLWESHADLWDAAKSKAVREFAEYIADNHITEVTKRLFKVPEPHWK